MLSVFVKKATVYFRLYHFGLVMFDTAAVDANRLSDWRSRNFNATVRTFTDKIMRFIYEFALKNVKQSLLIAVFLQVYGLNCTNNTNKSCLFFSMLAIFFYVKFDGVAILQFTFNPVFPFTSLLDYLPILRNRIHFCCILPCSTEHSTCGNFLSFTQFLNDFVYRFKIKWLEFEWNETLVEGGITSYPPFIHRLNFDDVYLTSVRLSKNQLLCPWTYVRTPSQLFLFIQQKHCVMK